MTASALIGEVGEAVDRLAVGVDPALVSAADAARLLAAVERVARRLDAVRLRLARRAEEAHEWRAKGFRSPEEWLARVSGTGVGPAKRMFETARQLEEAPATAAALAAGDVSVAEAAEVASAAAVAPESEAALLTVARRDGLAGVRKEADRVRAAALDMDEQHRRVHRRRHLRKIHGEPGELRFTGSLTADRGAELWAAIRAEAGRRFDAARREGRHESQDAYMLDALFALAVGVDRPAPDEGAVAERSETRSGRVRRVPPRPDRVAFLRVDAALFDGDGAVTPDDVCELVGVGPVPVAAARAWCADADLKLLFLRAGEVQRVVHLGRQVTEAQRAALYERAGFRCEHEGCWTAHGLEIDHITGWSVTRRTELDDLALWCHEHHRRKTYMGYRVEGPPGRRRLVPPPPSDLSPPIGEAVVFEPDAGRGGLRRARQALRGAIDAAAGIAEGVARPVEPGFT